MPVLVSAIAPWFGSNRMLARHVGEALDGCSWVGVLFAGGMAELPHIKARTIVVNDKHRHVINLARVAKSDDLRPRLIRTLYKNLFHPDELKAAQDYCKGYVPTVAPDLEAAERYFVCCWMGRSAGAGRDNEFDGRPAIRWKSNGGDSMVRYLSAIRMLVEFSKTARRCTFETMDAITEFLPRCEDIDGYGIYADPPFPGLGRRYLYHAGQTEAEERTWHEALRDQLARFEKIRVVCRFYEHPLIRELYPEPTWSWKQLVGRKQSREAAPEVLIINNGPTGPRVSALPPSDPPPPLPW